MTSAGRPLTDEQLRQQLNRRVGVAPLTSDDKAHLIWVARLRQSERERQTSGPRALGWVAGIAAVVVLALISVPLLIGSMATPTPTPNPTPTPAPTGMIGPNGVTAEQAIAIAQSHVAEGAELWSYAAGPPEEVMQAILGPGYYDPPAGAGIKTLVWAVAFKDGDRHLATVFLDLLTGAWLENRDTSGPLPTQHRSVIGFQDPLAHVANGTTLTLKLTVNGRNAGSAAAMASTVIDAREFGQAPWKIVASTSSGRELLRLEFDAHSAYYTTGDFPHWGSGPFSRLDLSCGRLDLWVGSPGSGPMPQDSFPAHDCEP